MEKTNAIRILDKRKIKYEVIKYTYDPENLDVAKIAEVNNLDVATVYKTLVAKGDKTGILVALVPGDAALDLKALAKASRNKKIALVPVKEIQGVTGYIRGGCSPLGMKKNFPVYIDELVTKLDLVYVNAGQRGLLFGLKPTDLQTVTRAEILTISKPIEE